LAAGVCKFNYGSRAATRTVLRTATDLMLDAMRELDESARNSSPSEPAGGKITAPENAARENAERGSQ